MIPHAFLPHRPRAIAAILVFLFGTAVSGLAQTFVAEWTAAAEGGVGPTGMVVATEGAATFLYVADHPRGRVIKFNTSDGSVAGVFGRQGDAAGDFNQPYGLARDPASGDLYVAERGNHRVSRITSSGAFVMAWGGLGAEQGQFNEPIGVTVDAAGDVYVTDHLNNRVQKFRVAQAGAVWTATPLAMWGSSGAGDGQLNLPYGITADAAGNIWVADGFNARVQRFNTSGAFQSAFGSAGSGPGQFIVTTWVGMDTNGELLVTSTNSDPQDGTLADANNQWISRFTPAGAFVSRWGGAFGSAPGQFKLPFGAVVGPGNRVYVSDYYNSRVQVFDLGGSTGGPGPDTTPPAVTGFTIAASTAESVTYQITFNEAVTGVDSADFTAVTTGGITATVGAIGGTGAVYTVPVALTGEGSVQLNLSATSTGIVDPAGNALVGGSAGPVFTLPVPGSGPGGTRVMSIVPPPDGTYLTGDTLTFNVRFSSTVVVKGGYSLAAAHEGRGSGESRKDEEKSDRKSEKDEKKGAKDDRKDDDDRRRGDDDDDKRRHGDDDDDDDDDDDREDERDGDDDGDRDDDDQDGDGHRRGDENKGDDDDDEDGDGSPYFTWSSVDAGNGTHSGQVRYVSGSGTDTLTFRYRVEKADVAAGGIRLGSAIQLPRGAAIAEAGGNVLDAGSLVLPWTQNPLTGVRINPAGAPAGGKGKAAQVIVLKPYPGIGVGESVTLPATTDSGLPITWILVSGNATLEGNVLTPKNKGAIVLRAVQGGSTRFEPAAAELRLEARERRDDRLVNLSSRLRVTGGDPSHAVVAGFVVAGGSEKTILIRAVGPGLTGFGIREALARTRLQLRDSSGRLVAENEGWGNDSGIAAACARVGAFKLGAGSGDSALLRSLAPGAYTAQVTSNGNGIALLEVYDASAGTQVQAEQLVNISTRGFVDTGDGVLVAGFVVTGSMTKRVLIRGIGPGLGTFGVPGVVADPVLELYANGSSATPLARNDNWESPVTSAGGQPAATAAQIAAGAGAAGAFPLATGSKDAAMIVELPPGNYSAVVRGAHNTTGAGLVEVYQLP